MVNFNSFSLYHLTNSSTEDFDSSQKLVLPPIKESNDEDKSTKIIQLPPFSSMRSIPSFQDLHKPMRLPYLGIQPDSVIQIGSAIQLHSVILNDSAIQPDSVIQSASAIQPDSVIQSASAIQPDSVVQSASAIQPNSELDTTSSSLQRKKILKLALKTEIIKKGSKPGTHSFYQKVRRAAQIQGLSQERLTSRKWTDEQIKFLASSGDKTANDIKKIFEEKGWEFTLEAIKAQRQNIRRLMLGNINKTRN